MRAILLTKGQAAIVDDSDYDWLSQWKWCALYIKSTGTYYAVRGVRCDGTSKMILMHRGIAGDPKGQQVDHRNNNTLDNRRRNLRAASVIQNHYNTSKHSTNTSGFKGVNFHKGAKKWRATISINRRYTHLGLFNTPEEASAAYSRAATEHHKEFKKL